MAHGQRRSMAARGAAGLGFLCGIIGLLAGLTAHGWKLGPTGWFTGGALLTLLAVFALVDGGLAAQQR
jgi:peptidoglycan/LPS O-acetylase OafA/YrhL